MKAKISIFSTVFLLFFVFNSSLSAQNQKESTKSTYNLKAVEINDNVVKVILGLLPATLECDNSSYIVCEMNCCWCAALLVTEGHGNASNPQGECPSCGWDLSNCIITE